jgi:diacylglycerol O-acyltransferase
VPDNRVSAILYDLPVGIDDPVERLDAVHEQMGDLKASHMADAGDVVTTVANLLPPMVVGTATRRIMRVVESHPQRSMNTVTTNVPGPQFPLYCLGRRMTEHRPFVPIGPGMRVGTAILSYDGRLFFGITGDFDSAPDVRVVAEGIVEGIAELVERADAP